MDLTSAFLPLLRSLPAETAHRAGLALLKTRLAPRQTLAPDARLAQTLWGLGFAHPLGLAAGFDKNAEAIDPLLDQGFSFVEIGSVTPLPQPGNPRPRLFRLPEDFAVINRMGFNNDGVERVAARLRARNRRGIVGVNLGKNKQTEDAADDYTIGVRTLGPLADYLVINVSSPNTPGLRALQSAVALDALIQRVQEAMASLPAAPPLLLKIAPDLTADDRADIAEIALSRRLDGLIVSNTTIARPDSLANPHATEGGGLSGAPLFAPSTTLLRDIYRLTGGRIVLVGVGGIGSAEQAYAKICAGARLLQLYSALVYRGPGLIKEIVEGLGRLLSQDGFTHLEQAIGRDAR